MKTKPTSIALTPKHRALFERSIWKWQRLLNLVDWRIGLSTVPVRGKYLAVTMPPDLQARTATIRLGESWDENNLPTDDQLERIACHEVLHIFLHEMLAFTGESNANEADKASAEHRVIQVLCNLMVPTPGALD
jgi:hypothetical protein